MSEQGSCYLHPLPPSDVEELRRLVRYAGGLCEAARCLSVSKGHLCNILAGRRKLFPRLLEQAKASLRDRTIISGGYLRVLSPDEWQRIHGRPYPIPEKDDEVADW